MSSTSRTEPEFPATTRTRPREDETARTILDRAFRRARRVSVECQRHDSVRPPAPGSTDWVDPLRVAQLARPRSPVVQRPLCVSETAPRDTGASAQDASLTEPDARARSR